MSLLMATTAVALLGLFGGAAQAANSIEGVWSFGGGAVAIQPLPDGSYQGTVVAATTFAVCEHPVGQLIWTGLRERPDGSFWGKHLWYHGANCEIDPDLGLTAYRVLPTSSGGRVLLVCFSNPGDASQPTIAPEGKVADDTYGCAESAPLAAVPGSSGAPSVTVESLLKLPPTNAGPVCRRSLTLIPRSPKYDPLKQLVVYVAGKKVATIASARKLRRKLVLRNLPEGQFTVRVRAVTVLEQRFTRTRVYRGCSQKVKVKGPRGPGHP